MKLHAFTAALFFATPMAAQEQICMGYADAADQLAGTHGEYLATSGLNQSGTVLQFFVNPATGDWTLLQLSANGIACLVTHGENWQDYQPPADL